MEKIKCSQCETDNLSNSKYCSRCGHKLPEVKTEVLADTVSQPTASTQDRKKKIIGSTVGMICFALAYYGMLKNILNRM